MSMGRADTLGEAIRLRRAELGLTQEELAERIGEEVRQSDISRLERGKIGLPRAERLARIAEALDLPMGELLARSGWAGADEAFVETDDPVPPVTSSGVLIADDEPGVVESLASLLESAGYEIDEAYDFDSLLAAIAANRPSLIIADASLPGANLQSLIDELRRRRLEDRAILMGVESIELGVDGVPYLAKPLDADRVLDIVAEMMTRAGATS
jgi:transcriptional regulator with XRE-family HTH domain